MRIAVVGAGAIGGYLGARLYAAGEEITFIARGANLAAIRAQGMRLIEEDGSQVRAAAKLPQVRPDGALTQAEPATGPPET